MRLLNKIRTSDWIKPHFEHNLALSITSAPQCMQSIQYPSCQILQGLTVLEKLLAVFQFFTKEFNQGFLGCIVMGVGMRKLDFLPDRERNIKLSWMSVVSAFIIYVG